MWPQVESSQDGTQNQVNSIPHDYRIVRHKLGESTPAYGRLFRFGQFVLDSRKRTLSRADSPVVLTAKTFEVLLFLAQNPNRLVTKEELLEAVWSDTSVEEGNLTRYISHLRKALGDDTEDARLIVTIARKGYQFTASVTVAEASDVAKPAVIKVVGTERSKTDPQSAEFSAREKVARLPLPLPRLRKLLLVALPFAIIAAAFWSYRIYRSQVTLSATDTIVLASIKNETSDPAFDDALNTSLRYATEQTPYLNVLGIDKVFGTLAELKLPPNTKLTAEVARKVCLRTNSKLVIVSSIADAGNGYRITVDATDCGSGRIVAGIREKVVDRNQVVHVLGIAVVELRRKLGEPVASLAKFNKPMEEALSSSVDALQIGATGYKHHIAGDYQGAIDYYRRTLELDPSLAATYEGLGAAYRAEDEEALAIPAITRAYELRARMTERSRLETEYLYNVWVTRDLDKAISSLMQSAQTFPRDVIVRINLAGCLALLGQPDKAAEEVSEAARLDPIAVTYSYLASLSIHAERFNEAQAALDEATARKVDTYELWVDRIRLAFLRNDQRAMQQQWKQGLGTPEAYLSVEMRAEVEEYYGRFRRARELLQQAQKMVSRERRYELTQWSGEPRYALWEAESGNSVRARDIAATALGTVSDHDGKLYLALAFARAGDIEQARKMTDALDQESPLDTLVQNYHLPTIRATMQLNENDPAGAIATLRPSLKYELSYNHSFNGLYPAYLRGLAYLQLGKGRLAAAEFQKLMDRRGLVGTDPIGALAYLQMARAQKMIGDRDSARKRYDDFLDLWKDADPDVPVLKQAKAEYANL